MDIEAELDALYRRPLGDFVGVRDALAKRLAQAGEKEAAARVKALAKPSLTAWAVNQLAFRAPEELDALAAAGAAVRAAHLAAAPEQQATAKTRRDAISSLLGTAGEILREAGTAMSRAHRQKISRTLEALSSRSPESAEPAAGRLARDLEPPGFDALADLAAALGQAQAKRPRPKVPSSKAPPAKTAPQTEKPEPDEAERRAEREDRRREMARQALDRQLDEARQAIAELEEKTAGLAGEAAAAAAGLAEAKNTRDALTQAALEAERAAREARARADEAGKSASRARFAAEAAAAAVERAGKELETLHRDLERLEREREKL